MSVHRPCTGTPSPKKPKTDLTKSGPLSGPKPTSGPSPKKFRPKKYYSPKKSSPKKTKFVPAESLTEDESLEKEATSQQGSEVYYTANFKAVLNRSLLSSNPERHVISNQEASLVKQFMELESGWSKGSVGCVRLEMGLLIGYVCTIFKALNVIRPLPRVLVWLTSSAAPPPPPSRIVYLGT